MSCVFEKLNAEAVTLGSLLSLADSSEGAVELKTLKTIDKQENSDVNLLCVTSDYGPVKGSVVQYSENVEKYLASIGPIRRSELEFLQLKSKIQEFLNQTNAYVLVENGVLEHDLGWSSIIEEDLKREISINSNIEVNRDFSLIRKEGKDELKSISATRLQSFSDCPHGPYCSKLRFQCYAPVCVDWWAKQTHCFFDNRVSNNDTQEIFGH